MTSSSSAFAQSVLPFLVFAALGCNGGGEPPVDAAPSGGGSGSVGSGGSAGLGSSGTSPVSCADEAQPSAQVLRRLTSTEYQLSLQELFGLATPPEVSQVPADGDQEGFRTIAALQSLSDQHLRAYVDVASKLGTALLADEARRTKVLGCMPSASDCLPAFVARFGKLAYRRALTQLEVDSLVMRAQTSATSVEDRFVFAIEALLSSASFLFRVEVGGASNGGVAELSPLELASRLSFSIWGRSPSAELLASAEQGALATPAGLEAATTQLLKDPRASVFFQSFFKQWLDFEELRRPNTPPAGWDDALLPQMIEESAALLQDFAWSPGVALTDALTANYTFVTPALGAFYGLATSGEGLQKVTFPAGHPREKTGLLTHAALISAKSDADLLAYRGKWLRGAFLCQKLEVPAGLLSELSSELSGLTYLQVIQKRNTEAACGGCHAQIDPLGAGFAQYDAAGHYDASVKPSDYGLTPRFEGAQNPDFTSLAELSAELKQMPQLASCVAEKAFVYTQGRFPGDADRCMLQSVGKRFAESGYGFPSLISALTSAPSFRMRRAPQ
ncbi:MAG: DUF1592 domain-containing protein [Myxococcales bacterium]|nr:MAG: DUF1592 domain-containing protein [Myxococcales bacterium]